MGTEKPYDLGERTFQFALEIARLVNKLPRTISNQEYSRQVIKSSGSVVANSIEANENSGEKDRTYEFNVSGKEKKESAYWLSLLKDNNNENFQEEFKKRMN